jgi:hypothetical protein
MERRHGAERAMMPDRGAVPAGAVVPERPVARRFRLTRKIRYLIGYLFLRWGRMFRVNSRSGRISGRIWCGRGLRGR